MEKKRSVGVTVYGVILMILGLWSMHRMRTWTIPDIVKFGIGQCLLYPLLRGPLIKSVIHNVFFVASFSVLSLRNWARMTVLWLSFIAITNEVMYIFGVISEREAYSYYVYTIMRPLYFGVMWILLYACIIIFFRLPTIKEQFK